MQRKRADQRGQAHQEKRDAAIEQLVAPVRDESVANRDGQENERSVPDQSCESSRGG